jgi:hypothetical protein
MLQTKKVEKQKKHFTTLKHELPISRHPSQISSVLMKRRDKQASPILNSQTHHKSMCQCLVVNFLIIFLTLTTVGGGAPPPPHSTQQNSARLTIRNRGGPAPPVKLVWYVIPYSRLMQKGMGPNPLCR